nr:MAG TPA_asm: hypothetical protein [Caudoviricetes sp.]
MKATLHGGKNLPRIETQTGYGNAEGCSLIGCSVAILRGSQLGRQRQAGMITPLGCARYSARFRRFYGVRNRIGRVPSNFGFAVHRAYLRRTALLARF